MANFTPLIKAILALIAATSLIGLVLAIIVICGAQIEVTYAQATLLISVCPIVAILAIILATAHYKIDETNLRLYVGFFDLFSGKVNFERILNVVKRDDGVFISYLSSGVDPIIAKIAIHEKKYDAFIDALLAKNSNIVYYKDKDEASNSK